MNSECVMVSSISSCDEQDPGYCQHIGQGVQRVMPTNRIATGLQRVKLHHRGCGCMQAQGLHSAKSFVAKIVGNGYCTETSVQPATVEVREYCIRVCSFREPE